MIASIETSKSPAKPGERRSKHNATKPTSLSKAFNENDPETLEAKKLNKRTTKAKEDKADNEVSRKNTLKDKQQEIPKQFLKKLDVQD